jgi:hypothetical protein
MVPVAHSAVLGHSAVEHPFNKWVLKWGTVRGSHSVVMNAVDDSVLGRWVVLSKMYQGGGSD